jgi:hypothetical protein
MQVPSLRGALATKQSSLFGLPRREFNFHQLGYDRLMPDWTPDRQ